MTFDKLSRSAFQKRSSIIAEQIVKMIHRNVYPTGSKLPPERTIAEQMGVSRPSVREAISALQIVGIVNSRPGDGNYVADSFHSDELASRAFEVLEESESPLTVLKARKAMEIGVVRLAISEAGDGEVRNIEEAWRKRYERGVRGDYGSFIQYGKSFHMSIAHATNNHLIVSIMDNILAATHQLLWVHMRTTYYQASQERIEKMLQIHNEIVESIRNRDADRATYAMEEHFDILIKQVYTTGQENEPETDQ